MGPLLRQAREEKGLSLRALAAKISVSPSLLSQVETGKTKPSVSTLYALVSELGISTDVLLGRQKAETNLVDVPVDSAQTFPSSRTQSFLSQRAGRFPTLEMQNGVRWERLPVLDGTDVEALRVTYHPGGSSSIEGHLMRHFGVEHVYLISGELELQIEFDVHTIHSGDAFVFDSQKPHLFSNKSDQAAVGIWYVVGRQAEARKTDRVQEHMEETTQTNADPLDMLDVLRQFRT